MMIIFSFISIFLFLSRIKFMFYLKKKDFCDGVNSTKHWDFSLMSRVFSMPFGQSRCCWKNKTVAKNQSGVNAFWKSLSIEMETRPKLCTISFNNNKQTKKKEWAENGLCIEHAMVSMSYERSDFDILWPKSNRQQGIRHIFNFFSWRLFFSSSGPLFCHYAKFSLGLLFIYLFIFLFVFLTSITACILLWQAHAHC